MNATNLLQLTKLNAETMPKNYTGIYTSNYLENGEAIYVREFYKDGRLHREDGPAVESTQGVALYCLGGIQFTEEEYRLLMLAAN